MEAHGNPNEPQTTSLISVQALTEGQRSAVARYEELHGITRLLESVSMAVRTVGAAPTKRRFGRQGSATVVISLLCPRWLVTVIGDDAPVVAAWRTEGAEIRRITQELAGQRVTGLQVTSFRAGAAERETTLVLVGTNEAGAQFETAVMAGLGPGRA
ncbi:MAG: hypothetical protein WCI74_02290 [Actinomycetes bacterium]